MFESSKLINPPVISGRARFEKTTGFRPGPDMISGATLVNTQAI